MAMKNTQVRVIDAQLGEVGAIPVRQDAACPPIQVAASAYLAIREASFKVGDDVFTSDDIEEWLA